MSGVDCLSTEGETRGVGAAEPSPGHLPCSAHSKHSGPSKESNVLNILLADFVVLNPQFSKLRSCYIQIVLTICTTIFWHDAGMLHDSCKELRLKPGEVVHIYLSLGRLRQES